MDYMRKSVLENTNPCEIHEGRCQLNFVPKSIYFFSFGNFLVFWEKKRFSVVATGRRDRTFITFDKCFVFVDYIIFKHVPLESKMFVFVDVGRGSQNWQFFAKSWMYGHTSSKKYAFLNIYQTLWRSSKNLYSKQNALTRAAH